MTNGKNLDQQIEARMKDVETAIRALLRTGELRIVRRGPWKERLTT